MTELIITPNYDKKTARFKGTIAGGESVKVTIVGAAKWLSSGLRLRVVCGCAKTVAMFPLKSEDGNVSSFEVEGDDLIAAPLELNTIQARFYTQGLATTAATFIVEDLENNILYFQDSHELHGWVKRDGDEELYDLAKFPGLIEDWRKQIESLIVDAKEVAGGIEVTICDGVSPAKTFTIRNGRDGQPGEPGRKGEDGKSLKFSDLTEDQKAELKGPKGDTGDGITDELKALPNKVDENAQAIEANRVAINTEENRAKGAEKELLTHIGESKANAAAAMTAASKAQDTADRTVTEIATLVGDDAGDKLKSARQIAAEEVAKVIAGADTNYDTLKEIADYIKTDATDAAQLKNKVTNLETNKADASELAAETARAKAAEQEIARGVANNGLQISKVESQIDDVDNRVTELEQNGGGSVEVVTPSEASTNVQAASAKSIFDLYRQKEDLSYKEKTRVWKCDFTYDNVHHVTIQAKFLRHYNDQNYYFGGDRDNNLLIYIDTIRLGDPDFGIGEYGYSVRITNFDGDVLFNDGGSSNTFPSPLTIEFNGYSVVCTHFHEADYNDRLALASDILEYEASNIEEIASLFPSPHNGVYNQDEDITLQDNGFYILRNCTVTLPFVNDGVPRRFVAYCHSGVRFKDRMGRSMIAQKGTSVISGGTATTSQLGIPADQYIAFTVRMIRATNGNEIVFLEF